MSKIGFNVSVIVKNEAELAEVKARLENMSILFNNIIDEWATGNAGKFNKSRGAEASGIALDADVFWQPLTEKYKKQKHKTYPADWLMVGTGDLKNSLTNKDGFIRAVTAKDAVFGMPLMLEDENKVKGNWNRRPVIFLDRSDTLMVKRNLIDWFNLGDKYKEVKFSMGLQRKAAQKEQNIWDMEWQARL